MKFLLITTQLLFRYTAGVIRISTPLTSFILCFAACLTADFYLAHSLAPNSDSIQSYNEMLSIRSGNFNLRNRTLATDNFVLTDLPMFFLGSLFLGQGPRLIYLTPFFIFILLLVGCLLLVVQACNCRRERFIGCYLLLILLGVPYGLTYNVFFWTDFHVATVATCLYAIITVAPALSNHRFHRIRLIPFTILLFTASLSDPLADALLLGPLLLLVLIRAWIYGKVKVDMILLIGCMFLALLGSRLSLAAMSYFDGFSTSSSVTMNFVSDVVTLGSNAHAILSGAQLLFNAKLDLTTGLSLHNVIISSRIFIAICTIFASFMVFLRIPRVSHDGTAQLLVTGTICLLGLEAMSHTFSLSISDSPFYPSAAIRFVLPPFIFLCIAGSIQLSSMVSHFSKTTIGKVFITGFGFLQAFGVTCSIVALIGQPPAIYTIPQHQLAEWLESNKLFYGVGDYWDTQLLQAVSGGKVIADPVTQVDGRLRFFPWLADSTQFLKKRHPQFAIITPGSLFKVTEAAVTATYGTPISISLIANRFYVARLGP